MSANDRVGKGTADHKVNKSKDVKKSEYIKNELQQWPEDDQIALADVAMAIRAKRDGMDQYSLEQLFRRLTIAMAKTALDEPTQYWQKCKEDYLSNAFRWAEVFFGCLLIAVFVIGALLFESPQALEISRDNDKVAIAQAIQHVVIFGTIVAAVFWGLRQVLRMWAFYDDMRADAVEREALFKTFAVLKGAGWLSAPDQTVILTALVNKKRRSNVIGPEAPVTPADALFKQVAEAIKKGDKQHP